MTKNKYYICINIIHPMTEKSSLKTKKTCDPATEIYNPKSNRCVKIGGTTYKQLVKDGTIQPLKKKDIDLCALRKLKKGDCPKGTKCNEKSGRCIKIGGKTDKKKTSITKEKKHSPKVSKKSKQLDFESDEEEVKKITPKPSPKPSKRKVNFESDEE